jgi:transcriptional regulator GlxA family with amidase domain
MPHFGTPTFTKGELSEVYQEGLMTDGNTSTENNKRSDSDSLSGRIAFVLSDACDLLSVCMVTEMLTRASELSGAGQGDAYRLQFLSEEGSHVRSRMSMIIATDKLSEASEGDLRLVLVAAGPSPEEKGTLSLDSWLRHISSMGVPVHFLSPHGSGAAKERAAQAEREASDQSTDLHDLRDVRDMHDIRSADIAVHPFLEPDVLDTQREEPLLAAMKIIRADLGDEIAREAALGVSSSEPVEAMLVSLSEGSSPIGKVWGVARWMKDNCHRSISVADVARECELSERTLLRHFQSHFGKSPSDYLREVRVEYARKLLSSTRLPADKIARQVGLANGDRLSKLFRRCVGMSPSEYRSRYRAFSANQVHFSETV